MTETGIMKHLIFPGVMTLSSVTEYSDPPWNPGTHPDFTEKMGPPHRWNITFYWIIIFKTDLCMFLGLKNETILNLNNLAN